MKSQLKYYIWIIGCQMNVSDSERVAAVLENLGYKKTSKETEADLILVMACSVRQSAIDRIFGKTKKWEKIRRNRDLMTVLSGCVLPPDKPKVEKIFDIVFDMKDLSKLPQMLDKLTGSRKQSTESNNEDYFFIHPKYGSKFQAYVPIMTGCDNFCTYCAVPYTKGREKSRPSKEIVKEISELIKRGCKEITLLGQNVNSYGKDLKDGVNFTDLLQKVNNIPGKFWIRFITSNPQDMSEGLIKAVKHLDKVCEYIHLPVQAGNNVVLKNMNRKYTREHYLKLIEKIRKEIPGVAISTDTIVGFPCETKKQFKDTLDLYRKTEFDMAYIAQYSPRAGTVAFKMKDDASKEEKKRRDKDLTKILEESALKNNKQYKDKVVEILIEKKKDRYLFGRTRTFKLVQIKGDKKLVGELVKVKIISVTPWAMRGDIEK